MTEKSYNFHTETQTAIFCIEENSIEEMGDNSTSWWETKFICGIATIISSVLGSKAFLLLCVTCVFCTVSQLISEFGKKVEIYMIIFVKHSEK